jgi:hypothetical protein
MPICITCTLRTLIVLCLEYIIYKSKLLTRNSMKIDYREPHALLVFQCSYYTSVKLLNNVFLIFIFLLLILSITLQN